MRLEVLLNPGSAGCQSLHRRARGTGDAGQRKFSMAASEALPLLVSGGVGDQSWGGGKEVNMEELRGRGRNGASHGC